MDTATRVVISYPADLSDWGRDAIDRDSFRAYLPKVHEVARAGETWPEFVGVGCCGSTLDVPLQVERVEDADGPTEAAQFTPDTAVDYEVREACDIEGGWAVQSAEGP
ncbi:MAG: hypothetical protein ABEJ89_06655 [Haloarculaceae archaeon]